MNRRGFTLVELLVVIGILAVLVALLLPVFLSAREKSHQAGCVSNLRQLTLGLGMYLQDNDGVFPPVSGYVSWPEMLYGHTRTKEVYRCPACVVPFGHKLLFGPWGYATNSNLSLKEIAKDGDARSEPEIPFPATTVSFCETSFYKEGPNGSITSISMAFQPETDGPMDEPYAHDARYFGSPGGLRHQKGSNHGFVDGHVKWHTPKEFWSATRGNDGQHPSFALILLPRKSDSP